MNERTSWQSRLDALSVALWQECENLRQNLVHSGDIPPPYAALAADLDSAAALRIDLLSPAIDRAWKRMLTDRDWKRRPVEDSQQRYEYDVEADAAAATPAQQIVEPAVESNPVAGQVNGSTGSK
ncbi:hypothetical protein [Nocardia gipuzkoensis]